MDQVFADIGQATAFAACLAFGFGVAYTVFQVYANKVDIKRLGERLDTKVSDYVFAPERERRRELETRVAKLEVKK